MTARVTKRPPEILLVEDDESDVVLTLEIFRQQYVEAHLHHVENGEECLAFLRRRGKYAARRRRISCCSISTCR